MKVEDVKRIVEDKQIAYFLCSFVELSGTPKAKLVPATHIDDVLSEGGGFAGFAAGTLGQGPHSPDMVAIPDWDSLTVVPWRPDVAWVAGNLHVEGESWPYCPRTTLVRYLERVHQEWGYSFKTGVEAEFHLVRPDGNGGWQIADAQDTLAKPCYDLRALHRNLDFITEVVGYMQAIGWDPYACDHEDANSQFEINFTYADALTNADRHTFFKWMVRSIAEKHGMAATFMPKPFAHLTGNGAHFHMSLWQDDRDLFADAGDELGVSELAYHFCGGLMRHAKALAAITNPLVNSYKRLYLGAPNSGATWAPVYVTYGGSNRTQMIRITGGHVENRIVDGAANPYLAATAMLAAGMDGIKQRIDPGAKNLRNLYEVPVSSIRAEGIEMLPTTLKDAIDHLERDEVICDALGDEFARLYIDAKRDEWNAYNRTVSQWELDNYITVY